jgi:hypothetical protein
VVGVPDDQVPQRIKEIAMGHVPTNGGAIAWFRLNDDLPESEWPVGCCIGNDLSGPEYCVCWKPVYDLQQSEDLQLVAGPMDCPVQDGMCGDCAYRKDSPERTVGDRYQEETLLDMANSGGRQVFFCHANMRRPVRWEHPDGRVVDGDPEDYQPPFVDNVPYRADGQPGLICYGWNSRAQRFRRQVQPDWLVNLVGRLHDGEVLPGGMVWETPPDTMPVPAGTSVKRARSRTRRRSDWRWPKPAEVAPMPMDVRVQVSTVLRAHPGRWARIYDGGWNGANKVATWLRRRAAGQTVETTLRSNRLTVAVYARYVGVAEVVRP